MRMSKEINELLKSERCTIKINEIFTLRKWTYPDGGDYLDRVGDHIELDMHAGRRCMLKKNINSRDMQGIIDEVAEEMEFLMKKHSDHLVKIWKGVYR